MPHERVMLENVFAGSEDTRLSSLKNRFYKAIPAIQQDIKSALKIKGMYLLDPDSANAYSVFGIVLIVAPFLMLQFLWNKDVFSLDRLADFVRNHFCDYLVAVCAPDDREDSARRAHLRCGSGFSGIHEPRGCRPAEAHASGHIRKISALRHGAGGRASLGAGVRRDRAKSTELVCFAEWRQWASIQSSFQARCTAWRRTCTRSSSRLRVPVRRDQVGAAAEDSQAVASAAAAAARSSDLRATGTGLQSLPLCTVPWPRVPLWFMKRKC